MTERNFKKEAEDFCIAVDEFAKGKLNNAEDLTRLTEIIYRIEKENLLEDISFSAKYAQGLLKIIQNRNNNFEDEYFEKIKIEYTTAVKNVRGILEEIINNGSSFIKNIFKEKYLSMTHESLQNLNLLIDDLSWVKVYNNDVKRSK
jgi:hypothetical protein